MRYDEDMSDEKDDGIGHAEDVLNALRGIEAGIAKSVKEARDHITVLTTSILDLERECATMQSVLDVTKSARVAMEELLEAPAVEDEDGFRDWPTESKAPEVPSNVTPIREEKVTAKSGIGAAVKQAKAKKPRKPRAPKPPKPPTERDKLKATHVSGVLGFDGAEKPDFL